jgi:hypothetical protein
LLKLALKLPEFGDKMLSEGDEEEAYIYFMRYVYLALEANKLPEHEKSPLLPIIRDIKMKKYCMEKAEILHNSLKKRYEVLVEENENLSAQKRSESVSATPSHVASSNNETVDHQGVNLVV